MTQLSGPTLHRCPACNGYFTRSILTFLHFYDDVPSWSDGKNEQWWAGIGSPAGRCPTCSMILWIDDADALMPAPEKPAALSALARLWHLLTGDRSGKLKGEREWSSLPREIKEAARFIRLSTVQDYIDALAHIASLLPDQEEYLRRKLWWASNDHHRRGSGGPELEVKAARANMERLLALLPSDAWTLERVELYRQLGRFQEALNLIPSIPPDQWRKAHLQQQWAEAGDSSVRVIPSRSATHTQRSQQGARAW